MKRTLLTALVMAATVCTASAQDQKTKTASSETVVKEASQNTYDSKHAQEWNDLLVTELKLTDEQQKKIAELNKAFDERRQSVENNPTATDEMKAERKAAMKKAQEAQFLKILTPEQQARYKELVEAKSKATSQGN